MKLRTLTLIMFIYLAMQSCLAMAATPWATPT